MEFSKLSAPSLKELFIHELEGRILSGKLEIGAQLPSERELADMMQVSRTVVNSGITEMANKGFLTIKPRVGTFVSDYRRNGTLDTLISIMSYNGGMLRKAEIKSILEIRIVLDTLAVQLTIPKLTDEEIALLANILSQLKAASTNEAASSLAFDFHHELGVISGNTLLPLIFYSFKFPICSLWERFCRNYGREALYNSTERFFHYIESRDLEGAILNISETIRETIDGNRTIYSEV